MRIAFVSTILSYPWGGADALWTSAAEAAAARGDQLLLAVSAQTAAHGRIGALAAGGARLLLRRDPGAPVSAWRRAWAKGPWAEPHPRWLRDRIRAFRPDLVVISGGGTYDPILEPALFDWLRSSATRYRLIANLQQEHPTLPEADRLRAREALAAADRVFFVSPRNLEITRRHLCHALPNAECLHNPLAPAAPLPWPAGEPWTLASLGRLEPVKGVDLLIAALRAALGENGEWRLNIYGRGPQRDYLEACARHQGVADRIRFPGFVSRLDEIWGQNHLLVSSAIDEGVPMTIPEAMLRGRPVLATRVGGADEWIEPGTTGFLSAAPTLELLAEALRGAWDQRGRWSEMGLAAARRTSARYRPDDFRRVVA
jgi:glycosyltransferase involved in cell wall biosynthesis